MASVQFCLTLKWELIDMNTHTNIQGVLKYIILRNINSGNKIDSMIELVPFKS